MEGDQRKEKKSSTMLKKLESCISMGRRVAPAGGCFSVYVGPEKRRFVIRTEFANHRLFRMLLEDAELEYGFTSEGPLLLPCGVDLFCRVLAEMGGGDGGGGEGKDFDDRSSSGSCSPFSRRRTEKGGGLYRLLSQPRLLRMNTF